MEIAQQSLKLLVLFLQVSAKRSDGYLQSKNTKGFGLSFIVYTFISMLKSLCRALLYADPSKYQS